MQVIDARTFDSLKSEQTCTVCVIGGGAAGLLVAAWLVRYGLSVIVLEAGGEVGADGRSVGIEALLERDTYRAATEGRFFGLGGTTARWGGMLVPHSELDFRPVSDGVFDPWRHIVGIVHRHAQDVATVLGLGSVRNWFSASPPLSEATLHTLRSAGLEVSTAERLPFGRRNFRFLLDDVKKARGNLRVFLWATASDWDLRPTPHGPPMVSSVVARTPQRTLRVKARAFVLAAGALESTRILLEMEQRVASDLFAKKVALGHYLSDHLSCPVADVVPEDRTLCAAMFGPRFQGRRLRSFRFIDRGGPEDQPRGFFHFIFENTEAGFDLARKTLAAIQARTLRKDSFSIEEVARGMKGLTALAWARLVHSKLHIPKETPVHLQFDVEQAPRYLNSVTLADSLDAFGRPKAVIRWSVSEDDYRAIRALARRFLSLWPEGRSSLPSLSLALGDAAGPRPNDVYHPVGTCRMGLDDEAVVDPELRVRGVSNLSLVSTGVFPSAGTANPTFSMLCLACAVAERLVREMQQDARLAL